LSLAARVASPLRCAHRSGSCWPQPSGRAACRRAPRCKWLGRLRPMPRGVGPLARTWCSRVLQEESQSSRPDTPPPADPDGATHGKMLAAIGIVLGERAGPSDRPSLYVVHATTVGLVGVTHRQRLVIRYQLESCPLRPAPRSARAEASFTKISELARRAPATVVLPSCRVGQWGPPRGQ
jgi:hypothetical protein